MCHMATGLLCLSTLKMQPNQKVRLSVQRAHVFQSAYRVRSDSTLLLSSRTICSTIVFYIFDEYNFNHLFFWPRSHAFIRILHLHTLVY